jgi:hypothetical protein
MYGVRSTQQTPSIRMLFHLTQWLQKRLESVRSLATRVHAMLSVLIYTVYRLVSPMNSPRHRLNK